MTHQIRSDWNWTPVPIAAIKDGRLSSNAKVVLADLWSYGSPQNNTVFPGIKRIAGDVGKSESAVRRALTDLRKNGWIEIEPRTGSSNLYHLFMEPKNTSEEPLSKMIPLSEMTGGGVRNDRGGVSEMTPITIQSNKTTNEDIGAASAPPPAKPKRTRSKAQLERDTMSNALLKLVFRFAPQQFSMLSSASQSLLRKQTTIWLKSGKSASDIEGFERWWYAEDWRGQKNKPPTFKQIRDLWGLFESHRKTIAMPAVAIEVFS